MSHKSFEPCVVGAGPVNIDSLIRVAIHGAEVRLSEDGDWLQRMSASEQRLASAVARFSRGLPAHLAVSSPQGLAPRHGFKGMQITLSALTAEALQASMPVASFSRSTESHNQDKVSMGTIAAREALRVCELVSHAVAVHLLATAQACELRGGLGARPAVAALVRAVRGLSPALEDDRCLNADIEAVAQAVAAGEIGQGLETSAKGH